MLAMQQVTESELVAIIRLLYSYVMECDLVIT